jgi:hypothetical protein
MKTVHLTNATMQDILVNDAHIKYELIEQEVIDKFKTKERRQISLKDKTNDLVYTGIVELDEKEQVIHTKEFKLK